MYRNFVIKGDIEPGTLVAVNEAGEIVPFDVKRYTAVERFVRFVGRSLGIRRLERYHETVLPIGFVTESDNGIHRIQYYGGVIKIAMAAKELNRNTKDLK